MKYVLAIIIGYAIGNIAPAYFVGKKIGSIDIREHGSGNAGATNVWRVLGARPGIFVFVIDMLKGVIAVVIGKALGGEMGAALAGCAVILGHDYPALLGFKGGKGVSTSFGVVLCLAPWVLITCSIIGIIIIKTTRYVSLGSICGMILAPIFMIVYNYPNKYTYVGLFIAILGVYRHRSNIKRLLNGTENKLSSGSLRFFNK